MADKIITNIGKYVNTGKFTVLSSQFSNKNLAYLSCVHILTKPSKCAIILCRPLKHPQFGETERRRKTMSTKFATALATITSILILTAGCERSPDSNEATLRELGIYGQHELVPMNSREFFNETTAIIGDKKTSSGPILTFSWKMLPSKRVFTSSLAKNKIIFIKEDEVATPTVEFSFGRYYVLGAFNCDEDDPNCILTSEALTSAKVRIPAKIAAAEKALPKLD